MLEYSVMKKDALAALQDWLHSFGGASKDVREAKKEVASDLISSVKNVFPHHADDIEAEAQAIQYEFWKAQE